MCGIVIQYTHVYMIEWWSRSVELCIGVCRRQILYSIVLSLCCSILLVICISHYTTIHIHVYICIFTTLHRSPQSPIDLTTRNIWSYLLQPILRHSNSYTPLNIHDSTHGYTHTYRHIYDHSLIDIQLQPHTLTHIYITTWSRSIPRSQLHTHTNTQISTFAPIYIHIEHYKNIVMRQPGVEPGSPAWKAGILTVGLLTRWYTNTPTPLYIWFWNAHT